MSLPTLLVKGNLVATGYGPKQKELDEFVPIEYVMNWFDKKVTRDPHSPNPVAKSPADKILLVRSSTGSGKSTVMMSELFHTYYARTRRNIACTQPRVFNAVDIPVKQVIPYNTKEHIKPGREPLVLEENIGYQTKAFTKKPTKGLIYMTIGVLTQQLKVMSAKEFMQKYSFIVIDEAHERSIDTDFVLMSMKKFIQTHYKNPECPFVIITSATFDPYKFADYMLSDCTKTERYENIIDVLGFSHEISDTFLSYPTENYIDSAVELALRIHTENAADIEEDSTFRDILIFVSGASEIKKITEALTAAKLDNPIIAISLTRSDIQGETQNFQNITRPYNEILLPTIVNKDENKSNKKATPNHPLATPNRPSGAHKGAIKTGAKRRIIVATNVGETGITYPNLKYVIDTGYYNSSEFDPTMGVELLINKPVTRGMYRQRRGRCGRNAPGQAFALYTKETYDAFQEDAFPEIIKSEITSGVLGLLISEVDPEMKNSDYNMNYLLSSEYFTDLAKKTIDIGKIDLLDTPSADSWQYSLEKLYSIGAIGPDTLPTPLGIIMSKFPSMRIESVAMILSSYAWGVATADLITIAAFLESRRNDIFTERNGELLVPIDEFTGATTAVTDDFIQYLIIYNSFRKEALSHEGVGGNIDAWGEKYGINIDAVVAASALRDEIIICMAKIGFDPYHKYASSLMYYSHITDIEDVVQKIRKLKQCIFEGYKLNVAILTGDNKYETKRSHLKIDIPRAAGAHVVLYDNILYMRGRDGNNYEPKIDNISILDGYISYDNII